MNSHLGKRGKKEETLRERKRYDRTSVIEAACAGEQLSGPLSPAIDRSAIESIRQKRTTGATWRLPTSGSNSFKAVDNALIAIHILLHRRNRKGYLRNVTPLARDCRAQRR